MYLRECLSRNCVLIEEDSSCSRLIRVATTTQTAGHQIEQSLNSTSHVLTSVELILSVAVVTRVTSDCGQVTRSRRSRCSSCDGLDQNIKQVLNSCCLCSTCLVPVAASVIGDSSITQNHLRRILDRPDVGQCLGDRTITDASGRGDCISHDRDQISDSRSNVSTRCYGVSISSYDISTLVVGEEVKIGKILLSVTMTSSDSDRLISHHGDSKISCLVDDPVRLSSITHDVLQVCARNIQFSSTEHLVVTTEAEVPNQSVQDVSYVMDAIKVTISNNGVLLRSYECVSRLWKMSNSI